MGMGEIMNNEEKFGLKLLEVDNPESGILAYAIDGGEIADEAASISGYRAISAYPKS